MLKLTYSLKNDVFQNVTVIGDPYGIRDLYWQLTKNHMAAEITLIKVTNLDGRDCTADIMEWPCSGATVMSSLNK